MWVVSDHLVSLLKCRFSVPVLRFSPSLGMFMFSTPPGWFGCRCAVNCALKTLTQNCVRKGPHFMVSMSMHFYLYLILVPIVYQPSSPETHSLYRQDTIFSERLETPKRKWFLQEATSLFNWPSLCFLGNGVVYGNATQNSMVH